MERLIQVLLKVLVLFLILAVGYVVSRCGILSQEGSRTLSRLVIYVTFPAYILGRAMAVEQASPRLVLLMLGLSFAHYLVLFGLAWLWPRVFRVPAAQIGSYRFMLTFANVGFVGFPVVAAVLGDEAVFAATMFNLPFNLLVYTVGVMMLHGSRGQRFNPRLLLTPSVVACLLAIVIALVPIRWPGVLRETCQTLGAITTPAALLIIGATLAGMPLRLLAGSPRLYALCVFRLVLMPLLVWAALRGWIGDPIILGVMVLLAGMPVATNGTMLCLTYGGDQQLMAQGTFLTTLLSLLTIPLMALLLQV